MEARSARFIGFCTQAMSVTESACSRWSRVTLLRPTTPISPLSRAFTMAASWSSNRWSGSASSISRKLTAARWPTARLRRLSSIPCLSWAGWSYRSTPPGRRAAGGGQQGRCTVAPLAGGAYQGGQNGQPLPGAGVHAGLAAPLGFAPADFLVADGAGRDPLGPAGRVLDRI